MIVKHAREVARQRAIEEGSSLPGFCGAYTAGSTNWLPDDADLATTSRQARTFCPQPCKGTILSPGPTPDKR